MTWFETFPQRDQRYFEVFDPCLIVLKVDSEIITVVPHPDVEMVEDPAAISPLKRPRDVVIPVAPPQVEPPKKKFKAGKTLLILREY